MIKCYSEEYISHPCFSAAGPPEITAVILSLEELGLKRGATLDSRGIESSSALHTVNNLTDLIMAGLGFGMLTADQSVSSTLFNVIFKLLFLAFIIYADKKLHWFDEVQRDDVEPFNAKHPGK